MNKSKLIETLADKTGVGRKQVEEVIDTMIETIISELKAGEEVTLTGFGTFLSRTRHARGGVNPQKPTERIQIPAVRVAKFKTGKTLKDALKESVDPNKETATDILEEAETGTEETIS